MRKGEVIFGLCIFAWLAVLLARSGIYIKRLLSETYEYFSTPADSPKKLHFPEIKACLPKPSLQEEEKYHLWEYRSLGTKCENSKE